MDAARHENSVKLHVLYETREARSSESYKENTKRPFVLPPTINTKNTKAYNSRGANLRSRRQRWRFLTPSPPVIPLSLNFPSVWFVYVESPPWHPDAVINCFNEDDPRNKNTLSSLPHVLVVPAKSSVFTVFILRHFPASSAIFVGTCTKSGFTNMWRVSIVSCLFPAVRRSGF
jgi:hypothetical protein